MFQTAERVIAPPPLLWYASDYPKIAFKVPIPTGENTTDHIEGIDYHGSCEEPEHFDYWYVHGDDLATNGKTWREIFNETPSINWG